MSWLSGFMDVMTLSLENPDLIREYMRLIGVDPEQGKGTDLAQIKIRFAEKKRAIWGGVSGALTVEQGTVLDTEQAVQHALKVLDRLQNMINIFRRKVVKVTDFSTLSLIIPFIPGLLQFNCFAGSECEVSGQHDPQAVDSVIMMVS